MTVLADRGSEISLMDTPGSQEIAVVLGTRSDAVTLAPVVRALRRTPGFRALVVSTGQHRDLLDDVLRPLGVRPDIDLAQADPGRPTPRLTARVVEELGDLLAARRPRAVLVHGDSSTAFGGALAAFSEGIPVAHAGAGLRADTIADQVPEEANRRLIAPLARWHLAPTASAAANLVTEGIDPAAVTITGSTGIDALLWAAQLQRGTSAFRRPPAGGSAPPRVLVTLHRRENRGERMAHVAVALRRLAEDGADVVLPAHPSPDVRAVLLPALAGSGVTLREPLGYLDFVATLEDATLVITDSGGVQEEAATLGRPTLVARETTERGEGLDAGVAQLVGTDPARLVAACRHLLDDDAAYARMARMRSPYGDGRAAQRVVRVLCGARVPALHNSQP
jgi:UDP-N-acetylglucosamine 2-epimerase (non-hydrolysing)